MLVAPGDDPSASVEFLPLYSRNSTLVGAKRHPHAPCVS
jgi:hypothetical protein